MIKKAITISIAVLLFCTILAPLTTAQDEIKSSVGNISDIQVDWTKSTEPIIPDDETRIYDISITYSVIKGIALRNILLPLIKNKDVNVALNIIDYSEWCKPSLDTDVLLFKAGGGEQSKEANLTVTLDTDAPAGSYGYVTVNVTIDPVKGPFNILTLINGYTYNFTVEFTPAYLGEVAAEFPEGDSIEISPYNETKISLDVANLGNAETSVFFEIVNSSGSFTASIDSEIIIDVDGKATADLIILADHKFDEEEIIIKLTPKRTENPTEDVGESINITLSVKNDGSYVEEEPGLQIDVTLMTAILIIIAFVIIALILLKRKK